MWREPKWNGPVGRLLSRIWPNKTGPISGGFNTMKEEETIVRGGAFPTLNVNHMPEFRHRKLSALESKELSLSSLGLPLNSTVNHVHNNPNRSSWAVKLYSPLWILQQFQSQIVHWRSITPSNSSTEQLVSPSRSFLGFWSRWIS